MLQIVFLSQDRFAGIANALGHADVLSQFTRPGQGTIDATNQMVDAIGMIQAEDRAITPARKFRILAHTNPTRSRALRHSPRSRVGFV